jgi:MFS family permease
MDVPTRQAYTMAVVAPEERTAAASVTGAARTLGSAAGPIVGGTLVTAALPGLNLVVSGAVKAAYDLVLYQRFKAIPLPSFRSGPVRSRTTSASGNSGDRPAP